MIRVLIVDDHPAMRAGLTAVLRAEPGLLPLAAVSGSTALEPVLERVAPDVVLLDDQLRDGDGLRLCRRIKRRRRAPAVLLYSAAADDGSLVVPAILAGADGVVDKSAPAEELYDALRTVARGEPVLPPVSRELRETAAGALEPFDLPILSMMLDATPVGEIAATLRLAPDALSRRLDAMIAALRLEPAATAA